MKDDDAAWFITTPRGSKSYFCEMYQNMKDTPKWIGVDWGVDSGFNRGEVIKKEGNVIFVRFKTVELN